MADEWSEHTTPEGREYWYNKTTQISSWEKPAGFVSFSSHPDTAGNGETPVESIWSEHKTDEGRVYYYNKETKESVWIMPDEYKAHMENAGGASNSTVVPMDATNSTSAGTSTAAAEAATMIIADPMAIVQTTWTTREEAAAAFQQLLEDKGVQHHWKWDAVMRTIVHDNRYRALSTLPERKQAFSKWAEGQVERERERKRAAFKKQEEDFLAMLEECDAIKVKTSYRKAYGLLHEDPRWSAVQRERDREDWFDDFIYGMERREKEEKRARRAAAKQNLRNLLEEDPRVTVSSQWRKVREDFKDEQCFKDLDEYDRLEVFEVYSRELEREETERKRKEKDERRRRERKSRESFEDFLRQKLSEGGFSVKTKWRDYRENIKELPVYKGMIGQSGSTPRELYYDIVEELEVKYEADKTTIEEALAAKNIGFSPITREEEYNTAIDAYSLAGGVSSENRTLIYAELLQKSLKAAEKEKQRRLRQLQHQIVTVFGSSLSHETTLADVAARLADDPTLNAVSGESDRKVALEHAIAQRRDDVRDPETKKDKEKSLTKSKSKARGSRSSSDRSDSSDSYTDSEEDRKHRKRKHKHKHKKRHKTTSSRRRKKRRKDSRRRRDSSSDDERRHRSRSGRGRSRERHERRHHRNRSHDRHSSKRKRSEDKPRREEHSSTSKKIEPQPKKQKSTMNPALPEVEEGELIG